ncbi:uncharacterized protein LOC112639963 [Camponotus floridanus]|uniref:uncharacterized protein LOC112639963 n=1 Tax=Camponotus floridanus TaxID=104421 RepID=UPI000DC6CBC7|nr:uncharacterized protein LOC112639963 [Camponotus floridanus]
MLDREMEKRIRKEEDDSLMTKWKNSIRQSPTIAGSNNPARRAICEHLEEWLNRNHEAINYRMTQMLSGHGCFRAFLHKIGKEDNSNCLQCVGSSSWNAKEDTANHTMVECLAWHVEREQLLATMKCQRTWRNIISEICQNKDKWKSVNSYVQTVIKQKEELERIRERQRHTNDRGID